MKIDEMLMKALTSYDNNRARSQQVEIGVSQIGGCRTQVWLQLQDAERTNDTLKLPALMGTAIHKMIEEALSADWNEYEMEREKRIILAKLSQEIRSKIQLFQQSFKLFTLLDFFRSVTAALGDLETIIPEFSETGFEYLDAPVRTYGSVSTPAIPLNSALEAALLPNADKVADQLSQLLSY
jgi:hypothetical protein